MRQLRDAKAAPGYSFADPLFGLLLQLWALISRQPAFTRSQLNALTAGDEFEVIDWPGIFVSYALAEALRITFQDSRFGQVVMPF